MKLIKCALFFILSFSIFSSNAGIIETDLTENDYYTSHQLDWAWASSFNVNFYHDLFPGTEINEFKLPTFHDGWRFATDDELLILINEITVTKFIRDDNSLIQAAGYWNTFIQGVDVTDFEDGYVASEWVAGSTNLTESGFKFETFYVRDVEEVPEPSTLLIFIMAIVLFNSSIRKKA